MRNGEMFIGGNAEIGREGLASIDQDDLSRNRSRNIVPRFFMHTVKTVEGQFKEVEYLELLIPGDSKSSPVHLVDDRLRALYQPNYKAFKEGREMPTDGIPIEDWLGANDNRVYILKSMHLRTVEAVAEISDTVIAQMGIGGRELKNRAAKFLEVQSGSKTADQLAAKDELIKDLAARLAKLENPEASDEEVDEEVESLTATLSAAKPHGSSAVKPTKRKGR